MPGNGDERFVLGELISNEKTDKEQENSILEKDST